MSPDLERIAAAVRSCPAVAGLHGGPMDGITTPLRSGHLVGIALTASDLVVGVVGRYPYSVGEIAAQVRAAVAEIDADLQVTVSVEDLHVAEGLRTDRLGPAGGCAEA